MTPFRPPRPVVHPALLNASPATRWTNLGWWTSESETYADAARALAMHVGTAAALRPGDVVVDVACGHGDSLALWIEAFGVARVVGVEPDPALGVALRARIAGWGLADRITVVTASAETFDLAHAVPEATAVVCVDAAYHFRTRDTWLRRLASAVPGTRLAFTDLARLTPHLPSRVRRVAGWAGIPEQNLWSIGEVLPAMEAAGFDAVQVTGCGAAVIDGFRRFARRSRGHWLLRPHRGGWHALVTAVLLGQVRDALTMVCISGQARATER